VSGFVSLLERLRASSGNPEATRSLVIVNSVELALQAADHARKLFPHWTVENRTRECGTLRLSSLTCA
jgi:ATP-dependent helicase IRC3